jgi:hypothetical protein
MPSNRSKCNTPENTDAAKLKKFTSQKLNWLKGVTLDQRVKHLPARVALLLSFYFNRVSGDAWPGQDEIASTLGVTIRAVQLALAALEDLGHLRIEVGKGRGNVNRYTPTIEENGERTFVFSERKTRTAMQEKANPCAEKHERPFVQNTLKITPERTPESISIESEDVGKPKGRTPENGFDEFWKVYPLKVAKAKARVSYIGVLKRKKATAAELITGAERYAAERQGQPPQYTKHAATWLNGERWLDEPVQSTPCPWTDRNFIDGRL